MCQRRFGGVLVSLKAPFGIASAFLLMVVLPHALGITGFKFYDAFLGIQRTLFPLFR
jgi:hypothetical protein